MHFLDDQMDLKSVSEFGPNGIYDRTKEKKPAEPSKNNHNMAAINRRKKYVSQSRNGKEILLNEQSQKYTSTNEPDIFSRPHSRFNEFSNLNNKNINLCSSLRDETRIHHVTSNNSN